MSVDSTHPSYDDRVEEWTICAVCMRGQQAVKEGGSRYLPIPTGFKNNPNPQVGNDLYAAYLERAQFYEVFALTHRGMVGLIHRQDAQVRGIDGTELEVLYERCTRPGIVPSLTLEAMHQAITSELLLRGRVALLTDTVKRAQAGDDIPHLALYEATALRNWSPDGKLFVLDESGTIRSPTDEFQWIQNRKFRVLRIIDGEYVGQVYADYDTTSADDPEGQEMPDPPPSVSATGVAGGPPVVAGGVIGARQPGAAATTAGAASTLSYGSPPYSPRARGGKTLSAVPIVVGGPILMGLEPDTPPLLGVARAALAMYRLDADYRHQLFMTGQETLFVFGCQPKDVPKVIGAGVIVGLPKDSTASFVSPTCGGINAHKTAIADESNRAIAAGVQLMDQGGSQQSGDALRLRYGAQMATLITIARQSAAILEGGLRNAATILNWSRQKVESIVVIPNLEFLETVMSPQEAMNLVTVWQSGAISYQTLYENFTRGGIASAERSASDEQELIDQEAPDQPLTDAAAAGGQEVAPGGGSPADAATPTAANSNGGEVSDPTSEEGPDSISDAELLQTFGSLANDVVRR